MKFIVLLSVLFVSLEKVYSAPSFGNHEIVEVGSQIIEGGPEILEEGPEIIEEGPEIIRECPTIIEEGPGIIGKLPQIPEEGSESFDSSRWTDGEFQTELSPIDRITKDPLGRNYKMKKSKLLSIGKFVTWYKQTSVKRWTRIYDVAKKVSGESKDFTNVQGVIDIVLSLGDHGSPPSPEMIWRKLITPTYDALQDDSLSEMERMWAVGISSKSHDTSPEFDNIFECFINFPVTIKKKNLVSLKEKFTKYVEKYPIPKKDPSGILEEHCMDEIISHLTTLLQDRPPLLEEIQGIFGLWKKTES
ncbi:uncharacterized protein MELLADRAFT_66661 [Melampsora larici-populina 98AG31]|uniref:Secreted protein n=1 Tax=Melampsora larici-populina (strain 98AG31 / pathotype 3-4-7) TaxID=747676 RepID=F4S048_MELLP|nr:uncharacterized protein MELLADRAFT_66661 [Melampsora larici-populina 98AG31]EGG02001.1 hypothetical protein MELLADRAFT_66661 [Melampsora larici-populina 98AG31]